ncbi:hypothetical protein SAMN05444369_10994 [Capnocytophaga haemolytica]|uniref:Uncharacterized protein n=1 Tax=Capnocytophaga haemolytica TaxID=45243 RepID=A0AAX2GYW7_9FLAO|nr:hypothetical protein SAMN05444369_10994 [Capnocytophaga haemolytica]SNV10895.1 Uncharacterised protein [Capnocytophaga haemolytica]
MTINFGTGFSKKYGVDLESINSGKRLIICKKSTLFIINY